MLHFGWRPGTSFVAGMEQERERQRGANGTGAVSLKAEAGWSQCPLRGQPESRRGALHPTAKWGGSKAGAPKKAQGPYPTGTSRRTAGRLSQPGQATRLEHAPGAWACRRLARAQPCCCRVQENDGAWGSSGAAGGVSAGAAAWLCPRARDRNGGRQCEAGGCKAHAWGASAGCWRRKRGSGRPYKYWKQCV